MTERIYLTSRARAAILWIAAAIVLLFLWQVSNILNPFIWAIVTAYVLNPVVVFLSRRVNLPRRLWAVIVYVALLALVIWGLGTLVPLLSQQIAEFARDLPSHFREAGKILGQSEIEVLGVRINLNAPDAEISRQIGVLLSQFGRDVLPAALPRVAESLLKLLVYLVSTFFLLVGGADIGANIARIIPPAARIELGPWLQRINRVLGDYIRGQLLLVLLMSVASYIVLTVLDVRYAPLLAIFTGLVETMPFVGPYTAGGTAVLVALTQGSAPFGWSPMVLGLAVAIAYTVLRQLEDNFVMPFLIGRIVHLHPLAVIFAVLAGAALGGILGLLLAVPVAATVKIIAIYLYGKLTEEQPRTLAIIEPQDNWDNIARRIRDAAAVSRARGEAVPRLLISVVTAPDALVDPAQFYRLQALIAEENSDAMIVTTDPVLTRLAQEAGIPVERRMEQQTTGPLVPADEGLVDTPLRRVRRRVPQRGKKETGGDLPA